MRFESLVSVKNLELAWRRINTGRNNQYKRFFRPVYLAYEAGVHDNLHILRRELLSGWKATSPTRIYLPKPSGLQRPITLLHVEDQIVLQAIANVFAQKLYERRKHVEQKIVFSNILSSPAGSIFFVDRWQVTYRKFLKVCSKHFNDGYKWVAHFDLAAYYDTISHVQLTRLMSPRCGHEKTWRKVQEWLKSWTTYDGSPEKHHGIPQGPIASNFLAEAFFLPIDEQMSNLDVRYTRYVDDIRVFGKTQASVQAAAIVLELACQSHGLIPQGKKFSIKAASSVDEVLGQLPSIPPEGEDKDVDLTKDDAEVMFREALESRPLRVKDKSRVRYVLYRSGKSDKLLRWVLALMPSHPEHIDAFCHYLSNYKRSKGILHTIDEMLKSGTPYPYVRGELWHVSARIAGQDYLQEHRPLALKELKDSSNDIAHRWGLFHFLLCCERAGFGRISARILSQHVFTQMLLAEHLPESEYAMTRIAHKILTTNKEQIEASLAVGRAMRQRSLRLHDYGMRSRSVSDKIQNIFKGLGVIRRRMISERDYVGEAIRRLYGCSLSTCWKSLLSTDYEYGLQILLEAEAAYDIDRSGWMRNQNSFNDMIVRAFIKALKAKSLPGGTISLVNRKNELVPLGVIVQKGTAFDKNHSIMAKGLREFNQRRNRLPDSYPYHAKGGDKNKYLEKRERDTFSQISKTVFDDIISACKKHSLV